ncbi:PGF-pre-PGF domain-containing protein [uncultured Methanoregula sp.]|uniref:PGF-pre-PGF domain-containing protein n=1 Tax=uncultured Methanoregula sp. TaxID=1005933 RepID=UPI002AAA8311|nr:PGF-pre-PGF domain-containing protein [uncultured Methanoregula sp.]
MIQPSPIQFLAVSLLIGIILLVPGATAADHPVMQPNATEMADDAADYKAAPVFDAVSEPTGTGPKTLINEFPKPSYGDWNQGECGNCWVWAGTALLAQSYYNHTGTSVPFSIQFFNSNYYNGNIGMTKPHAWACTGGNPDEFVRTYNAGLDQAYPGLPFVIPWSNYNASYMDASNDGNKTTTTVLPKNLITTVPNMGFSKITADRVLAPEPDNQTEAVRNITAALLDGKVIYYAQYWPDTANYTTWKDLWDNTPDGIYNPDSLNGSTYNTSSGEGSSHGMALIGYNKTDTDSSKWYWIVQNSWGNSTTGRPEGQFRLKMNINYNGQFTDGDPIVQLWVFNVTWKTDPTVTGITPATGMNDGNVDFTSLAGTGFRSGAVVNLTRTGVADITASDVTIVSSAKITGSFDLTNAKAGTYNVVVTNIDNRSGTLRGGFTVTAPVPAAAGMDSADEDSAESFSTSSPGGTAGQNMMFDLSSQMSETDPAEIVSVDVVPAATLGRTDLVVTDAARIDTAGLGGRVVNQVMSVSLVGVNPSKIDHADISFTVSRAWLAEHNVKPENIVLMRNTGGAWTELPTAIDRQTTNAYFFKARTPGFSYFAVTTRKNATAINAVPSVTAGGILQNTSVMAAAVMTSPVAATSSLPAAQPTVTAATTAVPPAGTNPGTGSVVPVPEIGAGIAAIVIAAAAIVLFRRWWIRRQNPALFRDDPFFGRRR